jgi:hypothetical protein
MRRIGNGPSGDCVPMTTDDWASLAAKPIAWRSLNGREGRAPSGEADL